MSDKSESILSNLNTKIENTYTKNTEIITEETKNTVNKCREVRQDAENRFKKYFVGKNGADVLKGIWNVVLPIILLVLLFRK